MSPITAEDVRRLIISEVASSLALFGETADSVPDDFDLRARGVIDSLGFIELVGVLSAAAGVDLEFDDMDLDELTVIGPLSRYVAQQASVHASADAA